MQHSLVLLSCCCTITVIVTIITLAARRERGKTGGGRGSESRAGNGPNVKWLLCWQSHLDPLLHSFQSPVWSACLCVSCHCHPHSLDSLQEAYSVVDLVGNFAENVLESPGLLVQVLEFLLGPVDHELCKKKQKKKRKRLLAPRHKIKMCIARTRACRQLGVASLLFCFILSGGRNRLCFSAADNKDG